MAIRITEDCINCDACVSECPNNAIYEPDAEWSYSDNTGLKGMVKLPSNGAEVDADTMNEPLSDEFYFIITDKCTECKGFHDEHNAPQFVRLIVVYLTIVTWSQKINYYLKKRGYTTSNHPFSILKDKPQIAGFFL